MSFHTRSKHEVWAHWGLCVYIYIYTRGPYSTRLKLAASSHRSPNLRLFAGGCCLSRIPSGKIEEYLQCGNRKILRRTMPQSKVNKILTSMQAKLVWSTRLQLMEALASISSVYRSKVVRRSKKADLCCPSSMRCSFCREA